MSSAWVFISTLCFYNYLLAFFSFVPIFSGWFRMFWIFFSIGVCYWWKDTKSSYRSMYILVTHVLKCVAIDLIIGEWQEYEWRFWICFFQTCFMVYAWISKSDSPWLRMCSKWFMCFIYMIGMQSWSHGFLYFGEASFSDVCLKGKVDLMGCKMFHMCTCFSPIHSYVYLYGVL